MKTIKLLAVAAIALIGCGDNKTQPDARVRPDSPEKIPAAPTLGAQIDRMGRAAVNTALTHGFDPSGAADTAKVAYNGMSSKTDWLALATVGEFMKNLAFIDLLDTPPQVCGNTVCEVGETFALCPGDCPTTGQIGNVNGCGNQALYNYPSTSSTPMPMSYAPLASVLAHDELFMDSGKTTCAFYLAVEYGFATGAATTSTCGGRAPSYDVIDFSFSMLAAGLTGFDVSLNPKVKDNAPKHDDTSDADFPFLGAPHS